MAQMSDLSLKYRAMMIPYRWRRINPVPCATPNKPIAESRVALVTTAGPVPPGAEPFDEKQKGGDFSYRVIPGDLDVQSLSEFHRSDTFDHHGIAQDRNLALPLGRLHTLAETGHIGEVAPRHLSFMGSITAPGRLRKQSATEAVELLVQDQVDLALLIPV